MKCARLDCQKKAAPGQKYCSKEHAPYGLFGQRLENNIKYARTGEFSMEAGGVLSKAQLKRDAKKMKAERSAITLTQILKNETLKKSTDGMNKIEIAPINLKERLGQQSQSLKERSLTKSESKQGEEMQKETKNKENGIEQRETNTSPESMQVATVETQQGQLTEPLFSLEEEKLASMSLVDDVITRLHLQMKALTLRNDKLGSIDPIGESHIERQRATLAIKSASEIGKMVRLKLEAYKTLKNKE